MTEIRHRTKKMLLEEIEGLVIRLNRAEGALSAIQSGNGQDVNFFDLHHRTVRQIPFKNGKETLDLINEGFVTVNQDNGGIICSNYRFSRMLGFPEHKLIGTSLFDLVRRDELQSLRKLMDEGAKGIVRGETHLVCSDGGFLPVFISASPVPSSQTLSMLVIGLDHLENAEKMLREERKRIFDILDEIPGFIYILTPEYKIRFANRYFRENFGDSIGKSCYEVLKGLKSPCDNCPTEKVLSKQGTMDQEFITKNNRTYHIFTYPMQDMDGSPLVFHFGIDMTEQKKAEEERARLAAAVEFSAEGVMIIDPEGFIEYVNPAFEQITGFSRQEMFGKSLQSVWEENSLHLYEGMWERLKQGNSWTGQMKSRKKDGAIYQEEMTIGPIKNVSGETVNYVAVKRDITERRRLESIAEAVNTMNNIGYIFSGIRHEIGNPVNSMKMTLNVLKGKIDSADRVFINEYVDRALSDLARLEYLLKALKNFNMYEVPDIKRLQIDSFIRVFISLISGDFEKKGISLELDISASVKSAYADPRALQQVLLNLMTNSADALQGRPNPRIEIKIMKMADMVMIRISDNGCGMTQKEQKELFMPFYTTKSHGTGLGLMLVKKMLSKMKGSIQITSQPGEGTIVDIFLQEKLSEKF